MVQLMGRIGSEPQLRGTEQASSSALSLWPSHQYRDSEHRQHAKKDLWHRVAIFKNGLRETCFKVLPQRERGVYITGEVQYDTSRTPESQLRAHRDQHCGGRCGDAGGNSRSVLSESRGWPFILQSHSLTADVFVSFSYSYERIRTIRVSHL
ncbi:hypothetical protein BV898_04979 [Hypsibius exemplaris]|uniref:Single-stranded DNA-binding protein, mitochondrial n=1 Tax=Hypsibius exemplaris TaxID=2072580 RepID=A0A1W0X1N7_HYPEX|nr:hypothetical protein BV898_04979 [Hypsibius exemplaris]